MAAFVDLGPDIPSAPVKRIDDPRFRVETCKYGSSPYPQTSIWIGQHQCVSQEFAHDVEPPSESRCGEIIVKHQLSGDKGHYSVLDQAFLKLGCASFPHSVMVQITRHRDSAFLVESGRYTGSRFVKVANGEIPIDEAFYYRPEGWYTSRDGKKYYHSEEKNDRRRKRDLEACHEYAEMIELGYSEEHARDCLPYNHRQHFIMSGTLKDCFHWLDQRAKRDSQLEIQTLAAMAFNQVKWFSPEIAEWYEVNRLYRARLAP